jgi:hypothetical protein
MLSIVTTLAIILHMFLVTLNYPVQMMNFFGMLFPLITFDAIPTTKLYEKMFNFAEISTDQPLTDQFNTVGYSSIFLVNNVGSVYLVLHLQVFILLVFWLLHRNKSLQKFKRVHNKIGKTLKEALWGGCFVFID